VAAQVREILANDPGTRLGTDPESLHRQRVAVRRLGSVLRAVHTLVELERVGTIRTELKLLGAVLGSVRDFDVIIGHLHEELLELRPADRAAAAPLLATLEHERRLTRTIMLADLTTARYFGLLDELERLVEELPELHGRRRLAGLARAEFERLEFAVAEAGPDPDDRTLHALRGRGKRARYAAELAGARAFAAKAKRFQDVLGRHQDAVVCEQRLRSLLESHPSVEAALVVGQLVERERAYRAVAHAQWPRAWKHVRRSGRATWS
jgi:CHAD domain-containing protein